MSTSYEPGAPTPEGFIPLCVPELRGSEWDYVKDCLDTGWVSSVGAYVDRFEAMIAERVGAKFAIAAVNGTAAIHMALMVAGVQRDDEVLVSTLTFIAPTNAVHYIGAHPVFIDADPQSWQMNPALVKEFIEERCTWENGELHNKETGRRVRAILPVHILGYPVDMDPILELARRYNLVVVEDATESLGASYKGTQTGHLGHIGCFSFNGNKIITTGGGGMIVTDNPDWAKRARYLTTQAKDDPLEYMHSEVGYNYRLTNIQAALGCAQMEVLSDYIARKRAIADRYDNTLGDLPGVTLIQPNADTESVCWMYTVLIDEAQFGMDSRALLRALADQQIQARPLWQPGHLSAAYPDAQRVGGDVADQLNRMSISLPCSVGLTEADQNRVIAAVESIYRKKAHLINA